VRKELAVTLVDSGSKQQKERQRLISQTTGRQQHTHAVVAQLNRKVM
jgi:hypothetical protein